MSATVTLNHEEVQQRLRALGISQNAMARAIRKDPAHVSRVLHGITVSAVVQRRVQSFLARAEKRAGLASHGSLVEQAAGQAPQSRLTA